MINFALEQTKFIKTADFRTANIPLNNIHNYANFLKQSLELWMFIPCKLVDGVWVVLEEPKFHGHNIVEVEEYQKAKERCLFDGFKLIDKILWHWDGFNRRIIYSENLGFDFYKTIEDLVKYNLELTPIAINQIIS